MLLETLVETIYTGLLTLLLAITTGTLASFAVASGRNNLWWILVGTITTLSTTAGSIYIWYQWSLRGALWPWYTDLLWSLATAVVAAALPILLARTLGMLTRSGKDQEETGPEEYIPNKYGQKPPDIL